MNKVILMGRLARDPKNDELNKLEEYVIDSLKGKVIIHKYDAFYINSIYLKFDYGVADSLIISDHKRCKHLDYGFNIVLGRKMHDVHQGRKYIKKYFPPEDVDLVIEKILQSKRKKQKRYRNYNATVEKAREEINPILIFWQFCKEIK